MISGRTYALSSMTAATRLRLGVAVSGFLALIAVDGPVHIPCLFSTVTGIQCPACGLTRSVAAISRGDLTASMAYHPMGVLLASIAIFSILTPSRVLATERMITQAWRNLPLISRFLIGIGCVLVAWVWNLNRVIPT